MTFFCALCYHNINLIILILLRRKKEETNFSLLDNINSTLDILKGTLTRHNIKPIINVDKNIEIKSYPNELIQIIINIINNAKDAFTEQEIENKYIFIDTKIENDTIFIHLKDNANGIKENIIKRIFDPYFTTKHQSSGTGLGLYMTQKLVNERLDGTITVSNQIYTYKNNNYKGAEFVISLKMYK